MYLQSKDTVLTHIDLIRPDVKVLELRAQRYPEPISAEGIIVLDLHPVLVESGVEAIPGARAGVHHNRRFRGRGLEIALEAVKPGEALQIEHLDQGKSKGKSNGKYAGGTYIVHT